MVRLRVWVHPTASSSTIREKMLKKVSFNDFKIESNFDEKTLPVVVAQWRSGETWERMLRHQWNGRIWDPPKIYPFWLTAYWFVTKNTPVSLCTNGHFQPTPFPLLSNAPSLALLIHRSLSISPPFSACSPLCFHLLQFHINTPMIL